MTSKSNAQLDPYTSNAENTDITPQHKIDGFKEVIGNAKTGMLTTRSQDGQLHARAMTPATPSSGENSLHLVFIGNNASEKFNEIEHDAHVNVSFYDPSSTNWASVSGLARISQDKLLIKKYWSATIAAYFGNLGDGVHKGDESDPRVSIIEVIPDDIRYWMASKGKIGRTIDVATGAVTGKAKAPGELRTITNAEIQLVEGLHQK